MAKAPMKPQKNMKKDMSMKQGKNMPMKGIKAPMPPKKGCK